MTEKRFTLKYINEQHISANLYDDKTFIGSIGIGGELIVELLNQLSEENEKLKKDCSNLIEDNTEYVAEINQMHKENEELKDFIRKEFPKSHKHILEGFE